MERVLTGIAIIQCLVIVGLILVREVRRRRDLVTPMTILLAMATLDVYLSGAIFFLHKPPAPPSWMSVLTHDDYVNGLIIFTAALAFMLYGYGKAAGPGQPKSASALARVAHAQVRVGRVYFVGLSALGIYLLTLGRQISAEGGASDFLESRLASRYAPGGFLPEGEGLVGELLDHLIVVAPFVLLACMAILFLYRHRLGHPLLWGWVVPFAVWGIQLSTFFRGSQLLFFLTLVIVERLRVKLPEEPRARRGSSSTKGMRFLLAAAIFFMSYGGVRLFLSATTDTYNAYSEVSLATSMSSQVTEFVRGFGLIGAAAIADAYPEKQPFIGGRTLVENALLPVPRAIWPDKPENPGVLSIAEDLGWPLSTQTAVTFPGELWANFGIVGLPLAGGFGAMLGWMYRRRIDPHLFFIYACLLTQGVLVSHWFSLIGFLNGMIAAPVAYLLLRFMIDKKNLAKPPGVERIDFRTERSMTTSAA